MFICMIDDFNWILKFVGFIYSVRVLVRPSLLEELSQPRRFADGTTITIKFLDFFNFSKCSNCNLEHTVKYEGLYLFGEEAVFDEFNLN